MGKGDKKTSKGKLFYGSYGKKRPRKKDSHSFKYLLNSAEMKRIFCAVGKGGFTVEDFKNFKMVYDCGGSCEALVTKAIDRIFPDKTQIDAVFISHLHRDHINGLQYLLGTHDVQKLFLPYLNEGQKLIAFIQNAKSGNSELLRELILNPKDIVPDTTKIVFVKSNEKSNNNSNEPLQIENITNDEIDSGQILTSNNISSNLDWIFLPFNLDNHLYSTEIESQLEKIGINVDNIKHEYRTKEKEILKIYINVLKGKGRFNLNSMLLYSGFRNRRGKSFVISAINRILLTNSFPAGCLYLGDYIAYKTQNMTYLSSFFSVYWNYIGSIQVPHHGSPKYYNTALNKNPNIISVIFAKLKSKYDLPTQCQIIRNKGIPKVVNENISSTLEEIILQ